MQKQYIINLNYINKFFNNKLFIFELFFSSDYFIKLRLIINICAQCLFQRICKYIYNDVLNLFSVNP